MIHVDTHVLVWLYAGARERFPESVADALSRATLLYSPMVRLELAFLQEIGRITVAPAVLLEDLAGRAGLRPAEASFERVTQVAASLTWTRDPFDRLIAAHALADDLPLFSADRSMLANCAVARWA